MTDPAITPGYPSAPPPHAYSISPPCTACGAALSDSLGCPVCGQLVGGTPGYRLATPLKRLGEYLLEVLLIIGTLLIGWLIWSLIIWDWGQTPAKQILGMRVYSTDNRQPASWGRMALREIVARWLLVGVISGITFGIGFIVSALLVLNKNRQTLWDLVASTVVVDEP